MYVIIASSIILIVLGLAFVLFIIQQRRTRHKYESIIEIHKTIHNERIDKLEIDNRILKKTVKELKERVDGLTHKNQ
jgi:CBS-domain-containing membrane protein